MSYLHSLSVFFSVVEEGSFSAAAKKLGLTQPTVSFHIDNMEKNFGCPLFTRTAKGVSLTIYGERLFENTHKINRILHETENQLKAMVAGAAGRICLGASTIPGEYILPGLLGAFIDNHPGVSLKLTVDDSDTIFKAFQNGEFPIAIVGTMPPTEYTAYPLWSDELVLIAHPDVAAGLPPVLEVSQLVTVPFVLRELTSGTRKAVLTALKLAPEQLNIVLEVGGNEALKAAVTNKIGIGFISKWAIQKEIAQGQLTVLTVAGTHLARKFYALCKPPLMPACVAHFWDFLIAHAKA